MAHDSQQEVRTMLPHEMINRQDEMMNRKKKHFLYRCFYVSRGYKCMYVFKYLASPNINNRQ